VFIDRELIGALDYRTQKVKISHSKVNMVPHFPSLTYINLFPECINLALITFLQSERTLSLLVENCGRVNYGPALDNQHKGVIRLIKNIKYKY